MRAIRVYRGILVHPTSKEQWKEEGEEGLCRNKDKDKDKDNEKDILRTLPKSNPRDL